jgi:nucleotide-binding universal stress UspA family protein
VNIKHMLVATDLSPEAMSLIPAVTDLARSVNARITLLHVVEALAARPHGAPLAPPLSPAEDSEAMESARAKLEERRAAFGADIATDVKLVTGDDAAHEITAYAAANAVDLIAVTTHGRTGIKRLALGSVAEGVIRKSRIPVLVMPLPKA